MVENKSNNWSVGRVFVRWAINTSTSRAVGNSPYVLAFGQRPRVGISSLPLAPELLESLATEVSPLLQPPS